MDKSLIQVSKRLSKALRHSPAAAGLRLDNGGWVPVAEVLVALRLNRAIFDQVVATNDKKRFAVETGPDGIERVRASQGHTIDVDLGLAPVEPPEVLFHGTSVANVPAILREGLHRGNRQYVHLSVDIPTAQAVGARRRTAVAIFEVAARMTGTPFYRSANGVWLTDAVPPQYLKEVESPNARGEP